MCGIHGMYALAADARPDASLHTAMGDVTAHRGPDDHGYYCEGPVLLGMRRLSIIDIEGGHQPIRNASGSVTVVCNGEIYNFRELRAELTARGHRFSTGSDTEVIVHAYEAFGDDFVSRLEGMFAFALWDAARKRLLIGRDRLGIKPLYYLNDGRRLIFASEAKAILAVPGVSAELDSGALGHYLSLGYVPGPYAMFAGMAKLEPGSLMSCEGATVEVRRYWRMPQQADDSVSEDEWAERLVAALDASVHAQMVSDVPLGAFLSGGIDSSCVVALMAKHSSHAVRTYSIGFDADSGGAYYNELPYARQVAERFGTQHKEIIVRPDVVSLLPKLLWHLDEPMADAAFITTFLVSEFARRDVTVILSGVGGDELFGGYRRYLGEYYGGLYNRLPGWLRRSILTPLARKLPSDRHSPLLNYSRLARSFVLASEQPFEQRYRAYMQVFSPDMRDALMTQQPPPGPDPFDAAFEAFAGCSDPLQRLMLVDCVTQLPDDLLALTDRMSMATSLECRVPLLDERLVRLAAAMPARHKIRGRELKSILKKALSPLLPDDILYRRKRGFGAPMGAWIKRELAPLLANVLSQETIERRGLFHWPAVQRTIDEHNSNRADNTDHLLSLMNLELWSRMYLDRRSPQDLVDEISQEAA